MNNKFSNISLAIVFTFSINVSVFASTYFGFENFTSKTNINLIDNQISKPVTNKSNTDFEKFMISISAVRRDNYKTLGFYISENQKHIDNVKIYPNPVSTQINVSYTIRKDNQVIIKILDILGNDLVTLLNQRVLAGEQSNTFSLTSKITPGFYFIKILSNNDSVIKRISVI